MSGGNSGSYIPISRTSFDCNIGTITTNLAGVNPAVLSTVIVGSILDVFLENNAVVVRTIPNGEMLGSVIHANIDELKECILAGNVYSAEIVSILGNSCRVIISKI